MTEKKKPQGRPPGSKNKRKVDPIAERHPEIKEMQEKRDSKKKVIDDIWGVTFLALGIFLIFTTQLTTTGEFGFFVNNILRGLFGIMTVILPYYFIVFAVSLFLQKSQHISARTATFMFLIFLMMCNLNAYRYITAGSTAFGISDIITYYQNGVSGIGAGAVGMEAGNLLVEFFGKPGLIIFSVALIIISLLLVINTPISNQIAVYKNHREEKRLLKEVHDEEVEKQRQIDEAGRNKFLGKESIPEIKTPKAKDETDVSKYMSNRSNPPLKEAKSNVAEFMVKDDIFDRKEEIPQGTGLNGITSTPKKGFGIDDPGNVNPIPEPLAPPKTDDKPKISSVAPVIPVIAAGLAGSNKNKEEDADAVPIEDEIVNKTESGNYKIPPISLLKKPKHNQTAMSEAQLMENAQNLRTTLKSFNVDAKILQVTQGSSVTRYEIQPAVGVKVNSIVRLADDIALNLRAKSIRIEAPIPGKAAVGIEVENPKASPVQIRELIDSKEFQQAESKISFAVGKDISGKNVIADLKGMPHMLIAGATGSGKSVCINTIITSILYKAKPDEVRFVLIDPKVVELGNYNGIPHMLIPVVTDPKKAAAALNWAVEEMTQRYKKFAEAGVRDLETFNDLAKANQEDEKVMPQVVIIIDELADLMMAAPSQVENSICRLAQMARAAGMHLIVATQRPSVDIVTGVIKANIPSRIAFSVSSQFDSRTIIDMGGAEKLLGKGDMLFAPVGSNKPTRIQGPYISDSEISKVISYVKEQGDVDYNEEVIKTVETSETSSKKNEISDELTDDAIAVILKSKQASVSMLQRRFRIGYNRAARMVDEIEEMGIIGPSEGSKPRQVLISEEEYYANRDEKNETEE